MAPSIPKIAPSSQSPEPQQTASKDTDDLLSTQLQQLNVFASPEKRNGTLAQIEEPRPKKACLESETPSVRKNEQVRTNKRNVVPKIYGSDYLESVLARTPTYEDKAVKEDSDDEYEVQRQRRLANMAVQQQTPNETEPCFDVAGAGVVSTPFPPYTPYWPFFPQNAPFDGTGTVMPPCTPFLTVTPQASKQSCSRRVYQMVPESPFTARAPKGKEVVVQKELCIEMMRYYYKRFVSSCKELDICAADAYQEFADRIGEVDPQYKKDVPVHMEVIPEGEEAQQTEGAPQLNVPEDFDIRAELQEIINEPLKNIEKKNETEEGQNTADADLSNIMDIKNIALDEPKEAAEELEPKERLDKCVAARTAGDPAQRIEDPMVERKKIYRQRLNVICVTELKRQRLPVITIANHAQRMNHRYLERFPDPGFTLCYEKFVHMEQFARRYAVKLVEKRAEMHERNQLSQ